MKPKEKHFKKALREIARKEKLRSCGTCTACCTSLGVAELQKPVGTTCPHMVPMKGCGIYARRPTSCIEWSCLWKLGEFDGFDRPDRVGVVVDATEYLEDVPWHYSYVAREAEPGGFERGEAFLSKMAQTRIVILVYLDGRRKMRGPPDMLAYAAENIQFMEDGHKRLPVVSDYGNE